MNIPTTRDYVVACIAGSLSGLGSLWLLSVLSNRQIFPLQLAALLADYVGRDAAALGFFLLETAAIVLLSLTPAFVIGLVLGAILYQRPFLPAVLATLVLVLFHALPMPFVNPAHDHNLFLLQYLEIAILALGVFLLSGKLGALTRLRTRIT